MKNLFTLLLLVVSLGAIGQTNNTSEEIKYWKSIADSNDTVAYRQYLNRYGENGLYHDEAITRITLVRASRKQQSKNTECYFYMKSKKLYNAKNEDDVYVVRFVDNQDKVGIYQDKVWTKCINYNTVRQSLSLSREYYESLELTDEMRHWYDDELKEWKKEFVGWNTNEEYKYTSMKSTSARDVYFKRDELFLIEREYHEINRPITSYPPIYIYPDDVFWEISYGEKTKQLGDWLWSEEKGKRITTPCFCFTIRKITQGYRYVAFSKDKSSFIMWFEADDNLDGQIFEKREYYRVPKEDLLPKAVNYDFLNK